MKNQLTSKDFQNQMKQKDKAILELESNYSKLQRELRNQIEYFY